MSMLNKPLHRALRRHHAARLKKARASYWGGRQYPNSATALAKLVQHPAICSCAMCGNPRKYRGLATVQEQAILQARLHALEADERERMPNLALQWPKPTSW